MYFKTGEYVKKQALFPIKVDLRLGKMKKTFEKKIFFQGPIFPSCPPQPCVEED